MQKTTSNTRKQPTVLAAALAAAGLTKDREPTSDERNAVSDSTTRIGKGASSKVQSKRDKAVGKGVTRDYSAQGMKDAKMIQTIEGAADAERVKVFLGMAQFRTFGFGATTGKKRKFADTTESYFNGWKKHRDSLPEAEKAAFGVRYAEARRICHAFCIEGENADWPKGKTEAVLTGAGSYHQKLRLLPTMTGGGQGAGARTAPTKGTPAVTGGNKVNELATAEKSQRTQIIAQFKTEEVGEIIGGLPETQLTAACHALAIRLNASSDKVLKGIGASLTKAMRDLKEVEPPSAEGKTKAA